MTDQNQDSPDQITDPVHGADRSKIPNPKPPVDNPDPNAISTVDGDQSPEAPKGRPKIDIPGRPEGLPENFQMVEDLVEAYKESQRKITELGQGTPAPKPKGEGEGEGDQGGDVGGTTRPTISDLMDAAEQEFATTGTVSATTRANLEAAGVAPSRIDSFIRGVEAQAREELSRLHQAAGGEALMQTMFSWASQNLDRTELQALNASLDAGGDLAVQAVRALSQVYHATEGKVPTLLTGGPNTNPEGMDVYPPGPEGRRMMVMDMRKPEYNDPNNPAFRRKVDAKIERSNL